MSHLKCWVVAILLSVSGACFGQCVTNPVPSSPLPATAFVQNVAHITTGGGFVTKFTIVNLSASANTIVFNDVNQDGTPKASQSCTIAANGTLRLSEGVATAGSETHWALVGSQAPVGVNLFFEFTQSGSVVNTVGFNDVPAKSSATFPVEFQGTPFHTLGVAIANPNTSSNSITVALVDKNGGTLGTRSQSLPAFGQLAADLTQSTSSPLNISSLLPAGNFVGSVVVTGSASFSVVGVGDDQGPFFSEAPMGLDGGASLHISATDAIAIIGPGSCQTAGVALPGARSNMVIALSPNASPVAAGWSNVIWNAWVDSNDHVTAQFCKFAGSSASLISALTFNIRLLPSSQALTMAAIQVPAGSVIPNIPHTTTNALQCLIVGTSVQSANASSTVAITPASDPANVGWTGIQWQGFVDAPGHLSGEFCKFGGSAGASTAPLTFNVAVLN